MGGSKQYGIQFRGGNANQVIRNDDNEHLPRGNKQNVSLPDL